MTNTITIFTKINKINGLISMSFFLSITGRYTKRIYINFGICELRCWKVKINDMFQTKGAKV